MKNFFIILAIFSVVLGSCKKTYPSNNDDPTVERTFRFQLYTDKDFSSETSIIKFSVFVRDTRRTFFDSSLAEMQLKDIPDASHKIIVEKTVLISGSKDLAAGFHYEIENVGHSGFTDTSRAGNTFKLIDFAFQ